MLNKINSAIAIIFLMILFFAGINTSFSQDKDKIREGISKVYELFNSGDLSGIDKYIEASYVEHTPGPIQKTGLDALKEWMGIFRKAFPDMKFTISDIIISDNKAAVLSTMSGTNTGEFMGAPATNKKVSVMGIDWL